MTKTNDFLLDTFDAQKKRNIDFIYELNVKSPEEITNLAQGIKNESNIKFKLKLRSIDNGILLNCKFNVDLWSRCSVCDKTKSTNEIFATDAFYLYDEKVTDHDIDELLDDYFLVDGRYIDLLQLTRDVLFENFEFAPICSEKCQTCEKRWESEGYNDIDERLSALRDLLP